MYAQDCTEARAMSRVKVLAKTVAKRNKFLNKKMRNVLEKKHHNTFEELKKTTVVNSKAILFMSFMGRGYSDSPRAIYLEMIRDPRFADWQFTWVFKEEKMEFADYNTELNRARLVKYGSREHYKAMARAKYIVSNSRLPEGVEPSKQQVYLQTWHGTPLKRLGADVIGDKNAMRSQKQMKDLYLTEAKKFKYLLSPSYFTDEVFSSAFGLKNSNSLLPVGYPRNDVLVRFMNGDVEAHGLAANTKRRLGITSGKKVVLYAPTWRDDQHSAKTGYTYKLGLDLEKLKHDLGDEYVILFRAHYFVTNKLKLPKGVIDVSKYEDISELYLISDMLITDYSSVFFDFAILDRPIVFYMYDLHEYRDEMRGFYIDMEELPGEVVEKEEKLAKVILERIKDPPDKIRKERRKFHKKFHHREDGEASKKIIRQVVR